ncbi:hypothetical protein MMA27_24655, partial [Salmonella enterica]|nr:hypothetical protein [Salmonella enterica]
EQYDGTVAVLASGSLSHRFIDDQRAEEGMNSYTRDFDRCRRWTMEGGFARMYPLQACVRLAVKLDFITALLKKSLECTGTLE